MQTNDSQASLAQVSEGSMLEDASTIIRRLSAPALFDAGQLQLTGLNLALASASMSLDSLALERVRLRESVETLTGTLFINGNSLAPKEVGVAPVALKGEPKDEKQPTGFWAGVVDSAKDKIVDKLLDVAVDAAGKQIKRGSKKIAGSGTLLGNFFERISKFLGGSQPSQGVQSFASVRSPVPGPHLPSVPSSALTGVFSQFESTAARRLAPIRIAEAAVDVIQGVRSGDPNAIGAGLGTAGGAWAGASAGAALGTLVLPGIGTAVGGVIGGLLGGEAGSWLGEKLLGSSDRLSSPDAVSKALNSARSEPVQVSIAPSIQITGINPADAQQVVNQVIQALQFQCMPMVTDALGIRRNAALADPGGD
jgi:hypothetical protein